VHKEKRNWLVQTCVVKDVMHQRKGDCNSRMLIGQANIFMVGKHTEIDRRLHVILKSGIIAVRVTGKSIVI